MKVPEKPCFKKKLPLIALEAIGRHYRVLKVKDDDIASFSIAGMFCQLRSPKQSGRLYKPISIYDVEAGYISFMIKILGQGTQALANLDEGDFLEIIGPLGNGFPLFENRSALLVSGGVGYPPLAWLKKTLPASTSSFHLHGGAGKNDIFPCDLASTMDGSFAYKGLVTDLVLEQIKERRIDLIYSCGPAPMLKALHSLCQGIMHFSSLEAYMACGIGVCYGCAVPVSDGYQRVCKEGPVFDANLIRWEEM